MAKVHVTFGSAFGLGASSVSGKVPRAAESFTSSASSQATTITALAGEIATIAVSGGPITFLVGAAPTAVATGTGYMIPDGGVMEVGGLALGDKVAIIDA